MLTLELDVTQPAQVTAAVAQAHAHFGRLDVVLNNAGYSLVGTIEEASPAEVRALYDTNIFGTLAVIQAALPLLRAQGVETTISQIAERFTKFIHVVTAHGFALKLLLFVFTHTLAELGA